MSQQRDRLGRYLPGHSGGPGRPKKKHDPAYLDIVQEVVNYDDWRDMVERIKEIAANGDPAAFKILAAYLLGKPIPAVPNEQDTDNPDSLASGTMASPYQLTPDKIKFLDREIERAKRFADQAADEVANKRDSGKKVR